MGRCGPGPGFAEWMEGWVVLSPPPPQLPSYKGAGVLSPLDKVGLTWNVSCRSRMLLPSWGLCGLPPHFIPMSSPTSVVLGPSCLGPASPSQRPGAKALNWESGRGVASVCSPVSVLDQMVLMALQSPDTG